jgi:hypothetical protein
VAITADMDALLDKAYEEKSLQEVLNAPVSALSGVSEADGEALKAAFNIRTVHDLGRNKYFKAAAALVALNEAGAK